MAEFTGRPAYLQIADDLRSQILNGDLAAGAKLPSETQLMSSYSVSRTVAKMAIGVLRHEGLITSHQGKGSFVRLPRPLRRLSSDRYARRESKTPPFAHDVQASGRKPEWEYHTERIPASTPVAERLKINPGDIVVMTHYRFFADGQPIQLSTSYEPLAITEGTPIEQPEEGSILGVVARMDSIGQHVTHVIEEVTTRAPRPYESEALKIPPGVHVLVIERTHYVGEIPVETCDIVVPGDRYRLMYNISVA
jgi:DNA-binding GntR family transcriptional regulator